MTGDSSCCCKSGNGSDFPKRLCVCTVGSERCGESLIPGLFPSTKHNHHVDEGSLPRLSKDGEHHNIRTCPPPTLSPDWYRYLEDRACNSNPLLLPTRQLNPLVANLRVVSIGERADKIVSVGGSSCLLHLLCVCVFSGMCQNGIGGRRGEGWGVTKLRGGRGFRSIQCQLFWS